MVVDDFDIERLPVLPAKTDTPLIVDSYAVLTCPITTEFLKTIAGWGQ
jgi:hypothetical protein